MNLKLLLLMLLVAMGCKDPGLRPTTKCNLPCYTASPNGTVAKPGVGACHYGTWQCPEDDSEEGALCVNQGLPSIETCDGIDNDCNGKTDEGVTRGCSNGCGIGYEKCVNQEWVGCTAPVPTEEVCDSRDNDCDGIADEPEDLPVEFCYDGPAGSTAFGDCRPGSLRCEGGHRVCNGQVTPSMEVCDGKDNDCDGTVDEGVPLNGTTDIVFVVDCSGSMTTTIAAVRDAVQQFATTYSSRSDLRWALVTAPDNDQGYKGVHVVTDFTNPIAFNSYVQQRLGSSGDGAEPTLDAISKLLDQSNPLGLTWFPSSKRVVVLFSDEPPQSWDSIPALTERDVQQQIGSGQTSVYVFTNATYRGDWFSVVDGTTYGILRDLSAISSVMEAQLTAIVQEQSCR